MKTIGLRTRIVVPTILLFMIGLGISAVLTYRVSRAAMEKSAVDSMNQIAEFASKSIGAWIGERERDLVFWSEMPVFRNIAASTAPSPTSVAEGIEALQRFNRDAPYYETIVLADRTGKAVCSTAPEGARDFNIADRDYFQRAMTGAVVVSDVILSKVSGNPVVAIAVPVVSAGKPSGVFLGALDLNYFTRKFVEPINIGASGYVFVTDRTGMVCSHPDPALVMSTNLADFAFGPEMMTRKNGDMRYAFRDSEALAAFRTDPEFGWIVVARAPAAEIMASTIKIRNINIATGTAAVLLAGIILLFLARSITRPVTDLVRVAGLVAQGRLAQARQTIADINRIRSAPRDETGTLWNSISAMADGLNGLVGQVQQSGSQLASTASEIAATSREQESVVANFSASTTEVVAASREISATSQELSQTMETVRNVAEGAVTVADAGRAGLTGMESSIRRMVEASASISEKLASINARAANIEGVVTTITKVADQTNLLSLNAAIEAEKAGEYGKGFAVVAREIRRLADQTAVATLDIERMVGGMQAAVTAGVMETDRFSAEVGRGTDVVATVSRQLSEVISQVKELAPRFETVNDGMRAQSLGARQITQALTQVSEGAMKTSDSLRQFNEATAQLRDAARRLELEVSVFQV